eukprot:7022674-Lingulodinium_polyedra.AAC.1
MPVLRRSRSLRADAARRPRARGRRRRPARLPMLAVPGRRLFLPADSAEWPRRGRAAPRGVREAGARRRGPTSRRMPANGPAA